MHREKKSIFTYAYSKWVSVLRIAWCIWFECLEKEKIQCSAWSIRFDASQHYSIIRICRQRVLNAQWNYAFFVWLANAKTPKAINLLVNSVHLCVSISAVRRFIYTLEIVIDSKSICLLGHFNNLLTLVRYVLRGNGSLMSTCSYGWHSRNVLHE